MSRPIGIVKQVKVVDDPPQVSDCRIAKVREHDPIIYIKDQDVASEWIESNAIAWDPYDCL